MAFSFALPRIFGYSSFVESINDSVAGKWVEWEVGEHDFEVWLFNRIYIVVSNERYYEHQVKRGNDPD